MPRDPAQAAQTPRQTPQDLRKLRKRPGKRRETCAGCANAPANAARPSAGCANAPLVTC